MVEMCLLQTVKRIKCTFVGTLIFMVSAVALRVEVSAVESHCAVAIILRISREDDFMKIVAFAIFYKI